MCVFDMAEVTACFCGKGRDSVDGQKKWRGRNRWAARTPGWARGDGLMRFDCLVLGAGTVHL